MIRMLLIAAALLVAPALQAHASEADNGAWCAVYSVGGGGMRQDCQWRTLEECRAHIIAGDRGTCNQNPRYTGGQPKKPQNQN